MAIIKCKMCGGDLVIEPGSTVAECEYCGSRQTVPTADNEKKLPLFARANRLRSGCEFDKAAGIYESIVADFPEEAEAYWGLVLCKYGIEYVDDPATGKKIPTCHRSSFDSILEDSDFEQACENADVVAQRVYREEAKEFERIRKGILEVSSTEKPYDIFICYKETDEKGDRTLDSVLAQDLYTALMDKGYRVFFSRVTLRDKLGEAFEPYIFAALNSAKVMLAVGTCYEYYNAVWVKNEWSRYLKLMASDKSKHLIPCYKDLDPEDMPREFNHLQGADLGKMGAIQDILFNMEKYIPLKKQSVVQERVVETTGASGKIDSQLQRGFMALEDGEWNKADGFFEEVLNNDFQNTQAYIGKALVQERQKTLDALVRQWLQNTESAKPETLTLKPDEAHIEQAVQKYAIEGYFEPETIRKAYDFDLSYPSTVSGRQQQDQQIRSQWKNHQWLSKAEKFASGQATQTLEAAKKTLFGSLDQRLSNAKAEEEAEKKALRQRYEAFLTDTDKKVEELYRWNQAQKEEDERRQEEEARQREARYQELLPKLETARTPDALGQLAEEFWKLGNHRDSAAHAKTCEERKAALLAREAAKAAAKRKKRNILIATCLVLIAVAAAVIKFVLIPALDYQKAVKLMEQGDYEEAIVAFTAMGDYRDSTAQIQACEIGILDREYDAAAALMAQGNYEEAITAFTSLGDHRDSKAQIQACKTAILDGKYDAAAALMEQGKYEEAITAFAALGSHRDSKEQILACKDREYDTATTLMEQGSYQEAITAFTALNGHRDSAEQIQACKIAILDGKYDVAVALMEQSRYEEAITAFTALNGHRDSKAQIQACETAILDGKYDAAAALMEQGSYKEAITAFTALKGYRDSAELSQYTLAESLLADGQKLQAAQAFFKLGGYRDAWQRCMELWNIIVQRDTISAGSGHTVGLKADGTVVAVGDNEDGQCDVSGWKDIVAISAGGYHTAGLKADGTVVAVGYNGDGRCDVSDWKDIVAISAANGQTIGLKADGTVVAVGSNYYGQCDVSGWKDIVAISAGGYHTVGLKADGIVVAVGDNNDGQCDVGKWKDIVAISAGEEHTVGLKADGTVVAVGSNEDFNDNYSGQCNVSGWKDIVAISAGCLHTVGLKADGTLVAVGSNGSGRCDVSDWKDIVAIAGAYHTVGLKADGTVVAMGWNEYGQCDVSDWTDIKLPAKP